MTVLQESIKKLMKAFPGSFINHNFELIAEAKSNYYICLNGCETPLDIKCKVLEWLSRAACKGCPYTSERRNREFRDFMLDGINQFLDTDFSAEDMENIYTYLGNAINHQKTIAFVESDFDMSVLREEGE